jgi:hypothetical protein
MYYQWNGTGKVPFFWQACHTADAINCLMGLGHHVGSLMTADLDCRRE